MRDSRQLALPFDYRPDYASEPFLADASNAEALAWLRNCEIWPGSRLVLWGEAGSGKSHLLHRWAAERGVPVHSCADLRRAIRTLGRGALAIDEADAPGDESALLHALNLASERRAPVLMSSRLPPLRWPVRLPDLASRIRASGAVRIGPPDEAFLRALLARLIAARQLAVPAALQEWLLLRLPRTPAAIREAAARLDRAAFANGTGVTRAVAARVLASFDEAEGDHEIFWREDGPGSSKGAQLL